MHAQVAEVFDIGPQLPLCFSSHGSILSRLLHRNIRWRIGLPLCQNELHMSLLNFVLRHAAGLRRLCVDHWGSAGLQLTRPTRCTLYQAVLVEESILGRHAFHPVAEVISQARQNVLHNRRWITCPYLPNVPSAAFSFAEARSVRQPSAIVCTPSRAPRSNKTMARISATACSRTSFTSAYL